MSTRDRILEATRAAYTERGYQGFSLRNVASRVGITPMAIYRYFEDKDHLLHQVLITGFKIWSSILEDACKEADPKKRLLDISTVYLKFAEEHEEYFKLMFLTTDGAGALKHVTVEGAELIDGTFQKYAEQVTECLPFAKDLPGEAVALWAHNHGLVSLHLAGRLRFLKRDFGKFHRSQMQEYIEQRMLLMGKASRK